MFVWVRRSVSFLCILLFSLTISSQVSGVKQSGRAASNRKSMRFEKSPSAPAVVTKTTPAQTSGGNRQADRFNLRSAMTKQPIVFFPLPQTAGGGRFAASGPGYSMMLGDASLKLSAERRADATAPSDRGGAAPGGGNIRLDGSHRQLLIDNVTVDFVGGNVAAKIEGIDRAAGYANFISGSDPAKWRNHVAGYSRVRYTNLYPGIDLIYYGELHRKLEYDLVVAAGADPQQIRLRVSGKQRARIDASGDLELDGPHGMMRLDRPVLYQNIEGGKRAIAGGFVQLAENEFGFRATDYDHTRPLIIDPKIKLVYGTYLGGLHDDGTSEFVLDAQGAAYITGSTASQDFPVSGNALQTARMNIGTYTYDAILTKFDASGTLIFSTFLGGSQNDSGKTVALDKLGNIFLAGSTGSPDFPVTANAFQKTFGGGTDGFLAELSNDGSQLLYSTYLGGGGDESVNSMRVNADGSFWIVGGASANGLPASATAVQTKPNGKDNGFVAKIQFDGNRNLQIPYLTFLGGSTGNEDAGARDLDVDSSGNVYVTGSNLSSDFPVSANAFEKPFALSGGCFNSPLPRSIIYITKFNPDLSQMLYSTVVGGHVENQNGFPYCNQFSQNIHVDAQGNAWIVGGSGESDFPTTSNAISRTLNGNNRAGIDTFLFELSADGTSELYGTYLGGSGPDFAYSAAWDPSGNIWIVSTTQSTDYPVTSDALQPSNGGGFDNAITELSPDGTKILYSTYLGGSGDEYPYRLRLDPQGGIHLTGVTASTNYPVTPNAAQPVYANGDTNPDTEDGFYTILGTGAIGAVGPMIGGNGGDTTITIGGAGFQQGSTCSLVQNGTTIMPVLATVNASGTSISCTFPLTGAAVGAYDVSVSNPDGTSFTKQGGFTVQSGGQPVIWSNIIGRPIIRTGTPSTFNITYGNSGNVDAYYIPISVELPSTFDLDIPAATPPATTVDPSSLYYSDDSDGSKYIQFVVPHLAPGQSVSIPLQAMDSVGGDTWSIGVTSGSPGFSSLAAVQSGVNAVTPSSSCSAAAGGLQNCLNLGAMSFVSIVSGAFTDMATNEGFTYDANQAKTTFAQYYAAAVADTINQSGALTSRDKIPVHPHLGVTATCCDSIGVTVNGSQTPITVQYNGLPSVTTIPAIGNNPLVKNPIVGPLSKALIGKLQDAITNQVFNSPKNICAAAGLGSGSYTGNYQKKCGPCNSGIQICRNTYQCNINNATTTVDGIPYPVNCDPGNPGSCKSKKGKANSCGGGSTGGAIDPNYKSGPVGDGSFSQFVTGVGALSYTLGFENEPTATLPAAQVVVTDQLDPTKVDLSTLTLGAITFGTNVINLPSGTNIYGTNYKLNSSLSVRIAASLDSTSGLLKWTFTSIDPSTGQPPSDPTVGFLPPDADGIIGQGSVLFNVMPKSGQSTNTVITNAANVIFDANAAIVTPTWKNTLDVDAPGSSVTALAGRTLAGPFPVSWTGTDKGSGVATYTVYVSDNSGDYTVFQNGTSALSASFTGVSGHTYAFYSIATDGAGNREPAKTKPDTTTAAVTQLTPLTSSTTLSASSTSVVSGTSVTLTATVSPPAGTTTVPTGTITFLNGSTTLGVVSLDATGKATLMTTTLPVGTDSLTAQYGGDVNFAGSTSAALSVTVGTPSFGVALNPASATVTSGGTATSTINLTSKFGFASTVSLACSGLPANATCSFSPATVTLAAGGSGSATVTIATGVHASLSGGPMQTRDAGGRIEFGLLLPLIMGPCSLLAFRRRRAIPRHFRLLVLLMMAGAFVALSGCGGPDTSTKTPIGTNTVTITATSGSATQTATLQLTVN